MSNLDPTETLLRIMKPGVCGGIIVKRGRVIKAAPVFSKMIGSKLEDILRVCQINNWTIEVVNESN